MDLELDGRVVLVVGGNGLIGSAVVARLEAEGSTVVVGSRSAPRGIRMDATDVASIDTAVAAVLAEHGRLDGLVVTAAPSAQTLDPDRHADPDQVIEAVDVKAMAFLRVANAVLPGMVEAGFGRVVGVSGQNAFLTGNVAGSVRNAALIIAAKNLADGVAGSGVRQHSEPGRRHPDPVERSATRSPWRVESRTDRRPDRIPGLAAQCCRLR